MKKTRLSLLCLLLSLVLILSFAGCRQNPANPTQPTIPNRPTDPTTPTEPPKPTESAEAKAYKEAAKVIEEADGLSLDVYLDSTVTVAGNTFASSITQRLSYSGLKSGSPRVHMLESVAFGSNGMPHLEETYIDGTLYVQYDSSVNFCGPMDKEACSTRYMPVIMLDAALYGEITTENTDIALIYSFSQPSGPEAWALPEGAVFQDASGSAYVNAEGALIRMHYTITYQYGGTTVTNAYQCRIDPFTGTVSLRDDASNYQTVQSPESLRYISRVLGYLHQSSAITVNAGESIVSQAAGVVRNESIYMSRYGERQSTSALIETDVYLMNYGTNQEQTYRLEEKYLDRIYTVTENGGTPSSYNTVSYSTIVNYCRDIMKACLIYPNSWKDVSGTDLGSTVLLELTFEDSYGETVQGNICQTLWNDTNFLNNLASKYVTNEISGYLAIDKFTGFPTAMGYYYSGTHTIQGGEYLLTMQADQSIEIPGMEAYYDINEKVPQEQAPEKKPTPLFYHVTGKDGQEMWLLGTIHIGDVRTAYLPKEIYDALSASDALALECDNERFEEQSETDEALQELISEAYFIPEGATLESVLGEELYETALKYMKASGNYNMNAPYMKPFAWNSALSDFYTRQAYTLVRSQGVESRLTALAKEQNKPILEIESALFQLQMLANFSPELQAYTLMSTLQTDVLQARDELLDLYEMWCTGDEAALREAVSTEVDTSEMTAEEKAEYEKYKHLLEEYNKAMNGDRNKGMLEVAKSYLESDQVVFYAVGLAHLLSEDGGLVDALRAAGYTVELVQYK